MFGIFLILSVFLWGWNVEIHGQLTGQCVLWGLCPCCRCVLGRQWVVAVRCGVAAWFWEGCPSLALRGCGRLAGTEVPLPLLCSALTGTHVLSYTLPLQQGWPKSDQKAGISSCFPWWVFLGETLSEAAISFPYLPLPMLGRGRWRSCGGCQTALPTSPPEGYCAYLVSRALWKHLSVCCEGALLEIQKPLLE